MILVRFQVGEFTNKKGYKLGVRISQKDIEWFTMGDCNIFAVELSKASKGKLKIAVTEDMNNSYGIHAFCVKRKNSKYAIDVHGKRLVKDILDEYDLEKILIVDEDYFGIHWKCPQEMYKGSRRRAKKIAKEYAERYS